jgi:hypothetical protein
MTHEDTFFSNCHRGRDPLCIAIAAVVIMLLVMTLLLVLLLAQRLLKRFRKRMDGRRLSGSVDASKEFTSIVD